MPTEVILATNIKNLGAEGDRVMVKPGFARNYLIPTGKALPVTQASLRRLEELKRIRAEREARELNQATEQAARIAKLKLTFTLKTGQQKDKAFGAISSHDILERLKAEGFDLERRQIRLEKPIKNLGPHEVVIALHAEVNATLQFEVVPETKPEEKAASEGDAEAGKKTRKKTRPAREASDLPSEPAPESADAKVEDESRKKGKKNRGK